MSDALHNTGSVISKPSVPRAAVEQTSLLAYFETVVQGYLTWRRARAAHTVLSRANDRTLRDIGVTRREITRGLPRADDEILALERRRLRK